MVVDQHPLSRQPKEVRVIVQEGVRGIVTVVVVTREYGHAATARARELYRGSTAGGLRAQDPASLLMQAAWALAQHASELRTGRRAAPAPPDGGHGGEQYPTSGGRLTRHLQAADRWEAAQVPRSQRSVKVSDTPKKYTEDTLPGL